MTAECVRCERPTPDGYACVPCGVDRPRRQLAEIAELVPAARDVAHRQARRGTGGAAGGKPGSQEPIDFGAQARIDAVQNALTTMARDIAETRGLEVVFQPTKSRLVPDPCIEAAKWLSGQMEWVRHAVDGQEPYAIRALAEIDAAVRVLRGVVDRPAPPVIVGMCDCGRTLYAPRGRQIVTCRDCEAEWDVDESRDTLREHLDERLVTAAEAAHLAAYLDTDRSSEQIRKLVNKWGERGVVQARGEVREEPDPADPDGRERVIRTYRFGDIAERLESAPRRTAQAAEMGA